MRRAFVRKVLGPLGSTTVARIVPAFDSQDPTVVAWLNEQMRHRGARRVELEARCHELELRLADALDVLSLASDEEDGVLVTVLGHALRGNPGHADVLGWNDQREGALKRLGRELGL